MPSNVPVLLLPTLAATLVAIATSAAWVARARATMPGDPRRPLRAQRLRPPWAPSVAARPRRNGPRGDDIAFRPPAR